MVAISPSTLKAPINDMFCPRLRGHELYNLSPLLARPYSRVIPNFKPDSSTNIKLCGSILNTQSRYSNRNFSTRGVSCSLARARFFSGQIQMSELHGA